jgi:hypothetical protein
MTDPSWRNFHWPEWVPSHVISQISQQSRYLWQQSASACFAPLMGTKIQVDGDRLCRFIYVGNRQGLLVPTDDEAICVGGPWPPPKAITIRSPAASAVVLGLKEYETRTQYRKHRGLLFIHAASGAYGGGRNEDELWRAYGTACRAESIRCPLKISPTQLLRGKKPGHIIGMINMTEVYCLKRNLRGGRPYLNPDSICERERSLGYWNSSGYAYKFEDPLILDRPVPCRGFQNLWDVPIGVFTTIRSQVEGKNLSPLFFRSQ